MNDIHGDLVGEDVYFSADDGLRLHARDWKPTGENAVRGSQGSGALPLVCLPGLARTADDFNALARAVCAGQGCAPRRVVALDYRGRGLSEFDRNWRNYDIRVENRDILTGLAALGIEEAVFLGTSRGGLHLMVLAAIRPGIMRRVILNDIGPVIEARGLARIRGYVGKLPAPRSWDDAVDLCKGIMSAQFSGMRQEDWLAYAHLTFRQADGKFVPRYDTKLLKVLETLDLNVPLPQLWPQFDGLAHVPMLVVRGENSDLLSEETLEEMRQRHLDCETWTARGQGHAPLLLDEASISRIAAFIAQGDESAVPQIA
jgi:pimeloyl-ACP methyl ester carboxylesterase